MLPSRKFEYRQKNKYNKFCSLNLIKFYLKSSKDMDKDPVQDENEIPLEEELFMTDQEYELMKHVCLLNLS